MHVLCQGMFPAAKQSFLHHLESNVQIVFQLVKRGVTSRRLIVVAIQTPLAMWFFALAISIASTLESSIAIKTFQLCQMSKACIPGGELLHESFASKYFQ